MKNDVNVPAGWNKHEKLEEKNLFIVGVLLLKATDEKSSRIRNPVYGFKDRDSSQNVAGSPEHWWEFAVRLGVPGQPRFEYNLLLKQGFESAAWNIGTWVQIRILTRLRIRALAKLAWHWK